MKIKNLNKSKLFSLLGVGLLAASSTLILASCSSDRQNLINKSVLTNGLGKFTDDIDLKTMSASLLKNNATAQTNFADAAAGTFAYKWVQNIAANDVRVKTALNTKIDLVNKTYDDTLNDYKDKYGKNFDIHFQQEFLDKNGGTEESYKQFELHKWAKQYLIDNVFATDVYVKLMKNSMPVTGGSLNTSELKNIFNESNGMNYSFAFQADTDSDYAQKEYASFQQYIYDQWVQYANPFLINNILWKYGQPSSGSTLSDYYLMSTAPGGDNGSGGGDSSGGTTKQSSATTYNSNISTYEEGIEGGDGGTTTPSTSTGSYIYPYFSSTIPTGNNTTSTVKKYQDFVTLATKSSNSQQGQKNTNNNLGDTNGLKKNLSQYSDDNTSSLMLVKNGTSYSDLSSIQLAAASSFMLYKDVMTNVSGGATKAGETNPITNKNGISKAIDTTWSSVNIDPITDEFIWSNKTSASAPGAPGASMATVSNNSTFTNANAKVVLSSQLVNEIISSKNLSSYIGNSLTSVDGFLPSNVNDFIFIRDNDGVRAVSIEGGTYINKGKTLEDVKKRAGNVVLFHYMNNLNGNDDASIGSVSIDLKGELSGFLSNNFNYLIFEYAKSMNTSVTNKLANKAVAESIPKIETVFTDNSEKTLIENLVKYNFESSISNRRQDYRQKMYESKSTYNANYDIDAKKNGLAATWIYGLKSNSGIYDYELIDTVPTADPYNASSGSKKTFESSVDGFTNSLMNQTSPFSGYKYSQYVYSNNSEMNFVLMNADDSSLSTFTRNSIFKKNWGSLYDQTTYGYKGFNQGTKTTTDANTLNGYVDNAVNNYLFSTVFDNLTSGKWLRYNELSKSDTSINGKQTVEQTFSADSLRTYRKNLWLENIKNKNDLGSFNSLLTLYATIDYLAQDNFKEFINYLQTKVSFGKDAYITWTNSINESIYLENNSSTQTKVGNTNGNLLEQKNLLSSTNISQNVENGYFSGYIGNSLISQNGGTTGPASPSVKASGATTTKNNEIKDNTKDSLFNIGSNYYKISNGMLGFDGIQTSDSNTLPTTIQQILFTKPTNYNPDKKGLFYSFKDREGLKTYINNIASKTQLDDLVDLIDARTGQDISEFKNDIYDLNQKKQALLNLVDNTNTRTSIITDQMFEPRDGIQTKEKQATVALTSKANANTNNLIENAEVASAKVKYAANVIQLNYNDVSSYETLSTRIMNSKATGDTTNQTKVNQNNGADEVIMNLLVYAAVNETSLQNYVVSKLSEQNKVNVYDIKLHNGLGVDWVKNWKE